MHQDWIDKYDWRALIVPVSSCGAIVLAAVFAYWPGLGGPFLFDDFGNISKIGDLGGVRNWETFKTFVFGGISGPTGRPLALASFLIDAQDWPAESWPFKRTNLVIHVINGLLLGALIRLVLIALKTDKKKAFWVALVSTGCWLLHPFLVSTTLYVVQRMAQLSTLFMFAGLLGYVYGRSLIVANAVRGYLTMTLSLGVFTVLAVLSKENGILLPLLAGVLEITVFANDDANAPRLRRAWLALFIAAPTAVIFLYLAHAALTADFFAIATLRNFSLYERLLTEGRVVVDYLQNWFIPKLYTTGVFQDHFLKSTGLLAPVTTVLSILLHVTIVGVALKKRRQWSLFSLAVLFFYGGHLLESTVLNLELYFEHRNYAPAAFLFVPLVMALANRASAPAFAVIAIMVLAMLGGFTRYSATVWTSFESITEASARKAPTSVRAQARYATKLFEAGHVDASFQVLATALERIPGQDSLLHITRLVLLCESKQLDAQEFDRVSRILSSNYYDARMIRIYTKLVEMIVQDSCPDVAVSAVSDMFVRLLEHPESSDPSTVGYSQIQYFIGLAHSFDNKPAAAVEAFEASLESRPLVSRAMLMAAFLATNEHFHEALHISDLALVYLDEAPESMIGRIGIGESDIRNFQAMIHDDLAAQQEIGSTGPES